MALSGALILIYIYKVRWFSVDDDVDYRCNEWSGLKHLFNRVEDYKSADGRTKGLCFALALHNKIVVI